MNRHGLLMLSTLGLGACQVIAGIDDRSEYRGPKTSTGGATSGAGGASTGSGGAGGASTGSGGAGTGGSSGIGTGGGTTASTGGTTASTGGTTASTGGTTASTGGAQGTGGVPALPSGVKACSAKSPVCPVGQTCLAVPGARTRLCAAPCATRSDCDAAHVCTELPGGTETYCLEKCPGDGGTCSGLGMSCLEKLTPTKACAPDEWYSGKTNESCTNDRQCLSNFCYTPSGAQVGPPFCADCGSTSCPTGDVCGPLDEFNPASSSWVCFHGCDVFATDTCAADYALPGSTCTPHTSPGTGRAFGCSR